MREIEFKVYIKDIKKIVDVHDIDFLQETIGFMNPYDTQYTWRKFNEVELMQYTGLKDKNGTKIFEGDIVSCANSTRKAVVKFSSKYNLGANGYEYDYEICGFYAETEFMTDCMISGKVEVIGNIYDNPDLLSN